MKTPVGGKQNPFKQFFRAILDLVILCVLLAIAAGGGYVWGRYFSPHADETADKANVQSSSSAKKPHSASSSDSSTDADADDSTSSASASDADDEPKPVKHKKKRHVSHDDDSDQSAAADSSTAAVATASSAVPKKSSDPVKPHSKKKYWITSTGSDYIGYNITVTVNDQVLDNFFAPGKTLDITRLVTPGDNTITFDAKLLGAEMNKHTGNDSYKLTLNLVSGPTVQESYNPADVILKYTRNAAETENNKDTLHFTASQ